MKINSIYGGMHTAANNVPDGENVKLLLRHSIRHEKPETDSPDGLLLTNEGIEMSKYFVLKQLQTLHSDIKWNS